MLLGNRLLTVWNLFRGRISRKDWLLNILIILVWKVYRKCVRKVGLILNLPIRHRIRFFPNLLFPFVGRVSWNQLFPVVIHSVLLRMTAAVCVLTTNCWLMHGMDILWLLTLSPLNWKQGKNISYRQNIMIIAIMLSQNCNGKFRKQEKLPASICMEKPGKQLASVKRWLLWWESISQSNVKGRTDMISSFRRTSVSSCRKSIR